MIFAAPGAQLFSARLRRVTHRAICPVILASLASLAAPLLGGQGAAAGERADVGSLGFERGVDARLALSPSGEEKGRALALYYRGVREQASGKTEKALATFGEVLAIDPGHLDLAARTAGILATQGRFDSALAILEESLAQNPDSPQAYLQLSEHCALFSKDDPAMLERAKDYARQAVDRFPDDPDTYAQLVALSLFDADREAAATVLEEALARTGAAPPFWLAIGKVAQQVWPIRTSDDRAAHLAKVNAIYERAVGTAASTEAVADYFAATRQYDRAIPLYRKLIGMHPEDLDAREKVARVLRLAERHEEALEAFESLVAINPYDGRVRELLASYYTDQERFEEAVVHQSEAIKLGENSTQQYITLTRLLEEQRRFGEAADTLARAAIIHPDNPGLPWIMADMLRKDGRFDEALDAFQRAEEVAQDLISHEASQDFLNYEFYYSFASAAERAKEYERAADLFRRSIDLVPEDRPQAAAGAYNNLGYMWLELETNIDEAGELIKFANQLEPDNGAYVDSLGWYYFLKGDYEEALTHLRRAAELFGEMDPVILDHIAQAQFKLGRIDEAVATLEEAEALDQEELPDEIRARLQDYRKRAGKPAPTPSPEPAAPDKDPAT
ncbi:hypothetical protein BH23VER1_BH23VER1_19060 [soil metagenome]